jgi:hypothetical protein
MGWSLLIAYYDHVKKNCGSGCLAPLILNVSQEVLLYFTSVSGKFCIVLAG